MHAGQKAGAPFVLGLGGGTKPGSTTERAIEIALAGARSMGARVELLGATDIMSLPLYFSDGWQKAPAVKRLVEAVRAADGFVIASPGYHGTISGAVKNAIDYIEETARDPRPYLTDVPVGLIGVAAGHQAAMGTLVTLRSVVHALRGWPTPLGIALNSRETPLDRASEENPMREQLTMLGRQVAGFVRSRQLAGVA